MKDASTQCDLSKGDRSWAPGEASSPPPKRASTRLLLLLIGEAGLAPARATARETRVPSRKGARGGNPFPPCYKPVSPAPMNVPPSTTGPLGQRRGIGFGILMFIITIGIYSLYWVFKTEYEITEHSGI